MHDHLLIDGRLVAGAGLLPVIEPASGQVFAQAPRADALQAEQAVAAGKRAARDWALVPMDKRAAVLEALADALQAHAEPFARMLTREQGKLLDESRGEVEGSIAALRYHAGLRLEPRVLKQSAGELVVEQRFPLGLVVAIVPWNYPLLMLILKLAPALLAGNTVIAKPAPTTPLTTLMLGALAAEIVPAGVVQVLGDGGDLGPSAGGASGCGAYQLHRLDGDGSQGAVGRGGQPQARDGGTGGNDAALVLDDADVGAIAADLFAGATANAGQICLGIKRIYAARNKADDLAEALADLARKAVVGDGLASGSTMGPVQNAAQHRRVLDLAEEARALGRVVGQGTAPAGDGYFIAPPWCAICPKRPA
jgi:acyl-CoA reductase-like NAD-dependent aldehyde dehydrogenase